MTEATTTKKKIREEDERMYCTQERNNNIISKIGTIAIKMVAVVFLLFDGYKMLIKRDKRTSHLISLFFFLIFFNSLQR